MTRYALAGVTPIAVTLLVTGCASLFSVNRPESESETLDPLVSTHWLAEHLADEDLVVLDCSVTAELDSNGIAYFNGREAYESEHIPSAGFADLLGPLSDPDGPFDFTAPSPEEFAAAMSALGVGDESRVVLYDSSNSAWAARVWWMLRWIGFDRAVVLDGGLRAWKAEGRPLSREPSTRSPGSLTAKPRPELLADRAEVLAAIGDDGVHIVDALPARHYSGEMTVYPRAGHVAGAINASMHELVDDTGRHRLLEEQAGLFEFDREERSITYCGSGIAGSLAAFVMIRLGHTDVALYDGGLDEWTADPENPMEASQPQER